MRRSMTAVIATAAICLAGCTEVTAGAPMADPDQTGITTTTTTTSRPRPTPTSNPLPPEVTPGTSAASTPPPNGMSTTCDEYSAFDDPTKMGMVQLLGDNGYPGLKKNPFLWVSFIGAMCVLADPGATVVQAINKKVPG
ncbi:hypothetical protein A5784_31925 [Mycobacterium sp. 852013-50091_SCH5140682]|uniref:hypothetical protein n=1 Tax=Mycobacterium sp. 852013-50091_SCH5140682 TaxID=1834109 RepID=UPI0007E96E0B|nr:hypothetical protein [Mycobacterium sp. 852013-50091_SCH5140682]OBC12970.1 hypothetical protein A5784_31925 [Mycobacterium sp. 852013-50091_SCH5140682]